MQMRTRVLFSGSSSIVIMTCIQMVGSNAPNTIRVAPPLTIQDEEIDLGFEVIDRALSEIDAMWD